MTIGNVKNQQISVTVDQVCNRPSPNTWFTVTVTVTSNVRISLDGHLVAEADMHHERKPSAGVILLNGFDSVMWFRRMSIVEVTEDPATGLIEANKDYYYYYYNEEEEEED